MCFFLGINMAGRLTRDASMPEATALLTTYQEQEDFAKLLDDNDLSDMQIEIANHYKQLFYSKG